MKKRIATLFVTLILLVGTFAGSSVVNADNVSVPSITVKPMPTFTEKVVPDEYIEDLPYSQEVWEEAKEKGYKKYAEDFDVEIEEGVIDEEIWEDAKSKGYNEYVADIIYKPVQENITIEDLVIKGDYILTPLTDVDKSWVPEETKERLTDAYDEVKEAGSVKDIKFMDIDLQRINNMAKELDVRYNSSIYEVTDMFDIELTDNYKLWLEINDYYARFIFSNVKLGAKNSKPIFIHRPDDGNGYWKVVPDTCVNYFPDGRISVEFEDLCPVAVLKVSDERVAALEEELENEHHCICPDWCPLCKLFCDENFCGCWVIVLVLVTAASLVLFYIVFKWYQHDDDGEEDTSDKSK